VEPKLASGPVPPEELNHTSVEKAAGRVRLAPPEMSLTPVRPTAIPAGDVPVGAPATCRSG
jgi:hypothetical protein